MAWKVAKTFEVAAIPITQGFFKEVEVQLVSKPCPMEEAVIALAGDADAVIALQEPFTRKVMEGLKKCRVIAIPKVGYDNFDAKAATELGICIANAGDYSAEEVSDHTMALLLTCARKIPRLHEAAMQGHWGAPVLSPKVAQIWKPMFRLQGQTLGLLGLGRIARTMVPKARGFGLKIIASDPYVSSAQGQAIGVEMVDLKRLFQESDYLSLHVNLTPETRGMVGLEHFKMMKPTAYFINAARGELVDTEALYTALAKGYIAGAGLDVIYPEPLPPEHPLFKLNNVILTAHSGHYSDRAMAELPFRPVGDITLVFQGKWPRGLVNPAVKEKYVQRWGKMD